MQLRHSVCALDCPDACGLLVHIEDGRATKLRGDPDHPVTRGFLCGKVAQYLEREYSPDRLLYPQKRTGAKGQGRFTRISWDEALGTIASRLAAIAQEHGAESILPYSYAGTMGLLNGSGMDRRFFHRLGASRLDRTICSSTGGAALTATLGLRYATEPEQFRHSKLIIAWGANIHGTNVHLWPFIVEARRNGAKLIVIDPVKTRTAALADRHLSVNPGSDLALALGLIHVIIGENLYDADYVAAHTHGFDDLAKLARAYDPARVAALTGISSAEIVQLARDYATTRPAAIRLNYGVQRSERGGAAVRAITALPALTGSWKEVGGGLQLSTSHAFHFNSAALEMPELQPNATRIVNMSELGKALTELNDPPVKAMVVYNSNPATIAPNQAKVLAGMRREDLFTVVLEQFQTDTADYADILLPSTTFLEHTDLYRSYGHYHVQLARPAAGSPRRNPLQRRSLPRPGPAHGLRRPVLPRFRRHHDSLAAALRTQVLRRHHARAPGSRTLHPPERFGIRHAVPALRRRRIRHALGQVRIRRRDPGLRPAKRIPLRRRIAAAPLPLGINLVEERRQHELHLRQPPACGRRNIAPAPEPNRRHPARHPNRRPRARLQ